MLTTYMKRMIVICKSFGLTWKKKKKKKGAEQRTKQAPKQQEEPTRPSNSLPIMIRVRKEPK